jgi:hypothetical protein
MIRSRTAPPVAAGASCSYSYSYSYSFSDYRRLTDCVYHGKFTAIDKREELGCLPCVLVECN